MSSIFIPIRPAKTHQIIARQILINLSSLLNLKEWQPIQEAALRDDDERSLSADVTVFDKEETAKVCIEIYKKPFSDNAKQKRYEELINYYPDLEEIFFVVYKPLLEYFDYDIQGWYKITPHQEGIIESDFSDCLNLHIGVFNE
jgi:hypothetical protein